MERQHERTAKALGTVLRRIRQRHHWTLDEVRKRSGNSFIPSVLGGYERGERNISVHRLIELANIYGVPVDRIVAEALTEISPDQGERIVIDLTKLSQVPMPTRERLIETIERIRVQRGDFLSEVISLRSGDLELLAVGADAGVDQIQNDIEVARREPPPRDDL